MAKFPLRAFFLLTSTILAQTGTAEDVAEYLIPNEIYEELMINADRYGPCWSGAIQAAEKQCRRSPTALASDEASRSGLLLYNCYLEKYDFRRVECPPHEDVRLCEAFNIEIRDESRRRTYMDFRNLYSVFCHHWTQSAFANVFDGSPSESPTSDSSIKIGIVMLLARSTELYSAVWTWTRHFLEQLSCSARYQLQVHFYPACNHCSSSVSRWFASTEVFVSDTWRKWKLFTGILLSDPTTCQGGQRPCMRANSAAMLASVESCLVYLSNICIVRALSKMASLDDVHVMLNVLVTFEYAYEVHLIEYAAHHCPAVQQRGDAVEFMRDQLALTRGFFEKLLVIIVACVAFKNWISGGSGDRDGNSDSGSSGNSDNSGGDGSDGEGGNGGGGGGGKMSQRNTNAPERKTMADGRK